MSRNLLHKTKLPSLIAWLDAKKIPHRAGRGVFQIMQIELSPRHWEVIYDRLGAKEHYTVTHPLEPLIEKFIKDTYMKG